MYDAKIIIPDITIYGMYNENRINYNIEIHMNNSTKYIDIDADSYGSYIINKIKTTYKNIRELLKYWTLPMRETIKLLKYIGEVDYKSLVYFIGEDFPTGQVTYKIGKSKYIMELYWNQSSPGVEMIDVKDRTNKFVIVNYDRLNKVSSMIKDDFYKGQFKNAVTSVFQMFDFIEYIAHRYATLNNIDIVEERKENFPIVCICGSTKFKDEFIKAARFFEAIGYVVLTTHIFSHSEDITLSSNSKKQLSQMYSQMIEMCDELHVCR